MSFPPTHALHVDPLTGAIRIDGAPLALSPGLPVEQVRTHLAAWIGRGWDHGNGYAWISLAGALRLADRPASMSLCFHDGRLEMVTLGVALPDDEEEANWPTEATILRHVSFMRRALSRMLGCSMDDGQARFPWGTAWANFDRKGFMATSGLSYERADADAGVAA